MIMLKEGLLELAKGAAFTERRENEPSGSLSYFFKEIIEDEKKYK